jgi:hypothetical protein
LSIESRSGDIELQAAHLAGDSVRLVADGEIAFTTATESRSVVVSGVKKTLLYKKYYNSGWSDEELLYMTIDTGKGGLEGEADRVSIDYLAREEHGIYTKTGRYKVTGVERHSVAEAIALAEKTPGMEWMAELARDLEQNVSFSSVTITDTEWNHDQKVINPVFAAVISVVCAVVVPIAAGALGLTGAGSIGASILSTLTATFGPAVADSFAAAISAMASSMVSGAIIGAIVGDIDFGQIMLAALSAGLSAGIVNIVNATFFSEALDVALAPEKLNGLGFSRLDLTAENFLQGGAENGEQRGDQGGGERGRHGFGF